MSANTTRPQNGTDSTDTITDPRELSRGDRVVFSDRQRPLEVVDLGVRTVTDERIDAKLETPIVRVRGDWDGAVDRILAHKINRWDDGIRLEELDAIVACEGDTLKRGEVVIVRRVARSEEVMA